MKQRPVLSGVHENSTDGALSDFGIEPGPAARRTAARSPALKLSLAWFPADGASVTRTVPQASGASRALSRPGVGESEVPRKVPDWRGFLTAGPPSQGPGVSFV